MNKISLSIKTRFSIYFSIFLSLLLAVFWAVAYYLYINSNIRNSQEILQLEFLNIKNSISYVWYNKEGLELEDTAIDSIEKATDEWLLIFIFDEKWKTLESPSSIDTYVPKWKTGYFNINIKDNNYLFYAWITKKIVIYVWINRAIQNHNENSLLYIFIGLWLFISIISFFVGYLFSSKALKPINDLITDIKKIDTNKINNQEIRGNYTNDEIWILAETFDEFVKKISNFLTQEKEFTQDISHELRTPLMVIKTSLELININELSVYQKWKVKIIEDSIIKIENLISELLFLARNFNEIPRENIDISLFLGDFLESYKLLAKNKNLVLKINIIKSFKIYTNKVFLEKVIWNLIKNAIFYTEKGNIKIVVNKRKFIISDTWIWIKDDKIWDIWTRFYRIKENKVDWIGLWLSIVKNIVIGEKWKINVKSEFGRGTSFFIEF